MRHDGPRGPEQNGGQRRDGSQQRPQPQQGGFQRDHRRHDDRNRHRYRHQRDERRPEVLSAAPPPVRFTDTIFLRGAQLITFDPPAVTRGDLVISNGQVAAMGRQLAVPSQADVVDATGLVVTPGFVDLRADLLSEPLPGFSELNQRSREVLGEEAVIWASFVAGVRALRAGTTCVLALQSAPGFALGTVPRLREVLLTLGLRAVLAYKHEPGESSSMAANRDAALYGGGEQLRMAVGVGDPAESGAHLRELGELAERCQVPFFAELGLRGSGTEGMKALKSAGVDGKRMILAVGAGLESKDAQALADAGATLVHVPRLDLAEGRMLAAPPVHAAGLGSGTSISDVLAAARLAGGLARGRGAALSNAELLGMLSAGHRAASRIFGLAFGSFAPGSAADFAVWRYSPSMPLTSETVAEHVIEGLRSAQLEAVIANGRFVIRNGKLMTLDEHEVLFAAQRGAIDLYQRLKGSEWPGLSAAFEDTEHDAGEVTASTFDAGEESAPSLDEALESPEWDDEAEPSSESAEASPMPKPAGEGDEILEWSDDSELEPESTVEAPLSAAAADDTGEQGEDDLDEEEVKPQGDDSFGFGVFS